MRPLDVNDHAPEAWAEIWEKSVSWVPASEEDSWLSLARRGLAAGTAHDGGADRKVSIERLCLSLLMSNNLFNSKVIKSFVPELRSRKCFLCFGIPMFYLYMRVMNIMNVLRTSMDVSISHVHVWLCNITSGQMISSFNHKWQLML